MDKPLKELRVVVTGAARGLGRTVVEGFLAAGARVHIGDVDASALEAARTALPDLGTTVCDVADQDQVDQLFDEVRAGLGGLDVLINNAGIAGPTAPMEAIEVADWMRTLAVDRLSTCPRPAGASAIRYAVLMPRPSGALSALRRPWPWSLVRLASGSMPFAQDLWPVNG